MKIRSFRPIGAMAGSACIYIALAWVAVILSNGEDTKLAISVLMIVLGTTVGWLIGGLGSPISSNETSAFSGYWRGIVTLSSGYLLGKVEPLLDLKDTELSPVLNPTYGANILILIASTVVAAIDIYVLRMYMGPKIEQSEESYVAQQAVQADSPTSGGPTA